MERENLQREEIEVRDGREERHREPFNPHLMRHADLPEGVDALSRNIIGAAIEVHRILGPGLIEKVYETALTYELGRAGCAVRAQVEIVVPYKEIIIAGQRVDLLVNELVILELKSISSLLDVHTAQLLSYVRSADKPLGLLFNFNAPTLRAGGIRRVFNERWTGLKSDSLVPSSSRPSRPPTPSR